MNLPAPVLTAAINAKYRQLISELAEIGLLNNDQEVPRALAYMEMLRRTKETEDDLAPEPTKPTRYTIEFSIHEVTEQGDTRAAEVDGCTSDYAFTNYNALLESMYSICDKFDNSTCEGEGITMRHPWEAEDEVA